MERRKQPRSAVQPHEERIGRAFYPLPWRGHGPIRVALERSDHTMNAPHSSSLRGATSSLFGALLLATLSTLACSDDEGSSSNNAGSSGSGGSGSGGGGMKPASDSVTEAVLAACPEASTLIQTTDWMSCLDGKRLVGTEPFSKEPCELRISGDGSFEYLRGGETAIAVPVRSAWQSPTGTYQNDGSNSRIFLASVAPDLEAVQGEPRVTDVAISLFELKSITDTVEVRYLDAGLSRQTYNCTVDAL